MSAPLIDRAFPPEQSDLELGDVYEALGFGGVHKLLKARAEALAPLHDDTHILYAVAEMFGISPGDIIPYEALPWAW